MFLLLVSSVCLCHAQTTKEVISDLSMGNVYLLPDRVKRVVSASDDGEALRLRISARLAGERWSARYTVTVPRSQLKVSTPKKVEPPQLIARTQITNGWSRVLEEKLSAPVPVVHRRIKAGTDIGPDLLSLKPGQEQKIVSIQTDAGGGRWMFFHLQRPTGAKPDAAPHMSVMQLTPKMVSENRLGDYAMLPVAIVNDAAALSLFLFTKGLSGYAGP